MVALFYVRVLFWCRQGWLMFFVDVCHLSHRKLMF